VYGAGAGWIGRLLAGGNIVVDEMRSERNPWFGGVNPEPIRPHIDPVLARMAGGGYDMGMLLDGDADRAGAVDERGVFLHQLQVFGLLAYYMLEHKKDLSPIVKTVNESSMGERLGERYKVTVHETPVGFKYVGPKMIETGASMGGEESGGYGFKMHLPERDGIFADLLLLDLLIRERALGRPTMSSVMEHVASIAGASYYLRIDVHIDRAAYPAVKERLATELVGNPPSSIGSHAVRAVPLTTNDGVKFFTTDGSWLLVRFSGTEPLVRVYAEATSAELRDELLVIGERLARGSARPTAPHPTQAAQGSPHLVAAQTACRRVEHRLHARRGGVVCVGLTPHRMLQ
jgi:phosphomannomutase